ncbi:hypothetical protein GGI03_001658 [Coemansia sp. RSA 2337]|nr:hypothetical protein H4S04_003331 [Coemansia sp. S16]KAJ2068065.1 hypothetical protein GGI08_001066 [Coemansia sp. S2]KAJ2075803.1 hypothetical protein GGH13_000359 [Coemansia sp. S155-1]KAJ2118032.1 hypothetical protein IW146_000232 [Coemansia sp. RSA 922]KAJ2353769.1 hypothetical protein GGH92_000443 [Coemansia sp. RSA 2673]KAJ2467256.1 hypothetical protein GGI03_001658 [Coemansia sp. RSA 2337]
MSTTITTMTPEQRVSKLFELLKISGKKEHISGNMTQLDHALRVANLAKIDSADEDTTLAELILNAGKITRRFDNTFGRKLRFSKKTCALVESNILDKRYLGGMAPEGLVSIIPKNIGIFMREILEAPIRVTIPMWGGPLSPTEMREFEKAPLFKQKMQLAVWDIAATKTTGDKPHALDTYRDMALRNLLMSMRMLY